MGIIAKGTPVTRLVRAQWESRRKERGRLWNACEKEQDPTAIQFGVSWSIGDKSRGHKIEVNDESGANL
jgi:hypothetical protein